MSRSGDQKASRNIETDPQLRSKRTLKLLLLLGCSLTGIGSAKAAVAQAASAASEASGQSTASPASAPDSGDIIVTANKRNESLRSVANSVTVLTGNQLEAIGAQSFKDYLSGLPGVQFQQSTPGVSNVTLRGIGTATIFPDQGQATTGIYINDVPLTDPGFAVSVPDLDVFDVQRVEVLKGPQGTLFGAATLGGAVNYIYNPVSLTEFQAHTQTSLYGTSGRSSVGYSVKAAINIPIVENIFGIRVAALRRSDPGYLDNVGTGDKNSNTHTVNGLRINALLKISDNFKLSYLGFYDHARNGDGFYSNAVASGLPASDKLVRDTEINEFATFTTKVNNIKLDGDLGFATLTVSAADTRKAQNSDSDYGDSTTSPAFARAHSQIGEVRLTSPGGQRFEWLVGGYYGRTIEKYPTPTLVDGVDVDDFSVNYRSHEKSVFGEATYHLTDTVRITAGGRYYNIDLSTETSDAAPGDIPTIVDGRQKGRGFSPKGSITYEPSKSFMVYGLISKGFRMGGVNLNPQLPGFPTPATYSSDSVVNYEIGVRASFLDHKFLLDTTAFYVDWTNIQLRLARPDNRNYVANAGSAHNYGVESSVTFQPSRSFDVHANVTYLHAELAKELALGNGTVLDKGTPLPGDYRWSTSETATYHLDGSHAPYLSVAHQYVSHSTDNFTPEDRIGNYSTFSLRAGAKFGQIDAQLFVPIGAGSRLPPLGRFSIYSRGPPVRASTGICEAPAWERDRDAPISAAPGTNAG